MTFPGSFFEISTRSVSLSGFEASVILVTVRPSENAFALSFPKTKISCVAMTIDIATGSTYFGLVCSTTMIRTVHKISNILTQASGH